MFLIFKILHFIVIILHFQQHDVFGSFEGKRLHQYKAIDNNMISNLANLTDMTRFKQILNNILVPRVVGTETHTKVKKYLINQMTGLNWSVETDPFEDETPNFGTLKFENIIARLNPNAERYLVLACHYDSKYMREGEFLGATDSAVPCTMMIDLAYALQDQLKTYAEKNLSLMFIFFDGEEAFERWGPTDSIYGARNLASKWQNSPYPRSDSTTNHIDRIDLLVLLDLLGAPNPVFYNYFRDSGRWYKRMISAENRLSALNLLKGHRLSSRYFSEMSMAPHIEDDHIPFLEAGCKVLHLIPVPFPEEWHTPEDNWSILDFNTIDNLNKIFRIFVLEYLKGYSN